MRLEISVVAVVFAWASPLRAQAGWQEAFRNSPWNAGVAPKVAYIPCSVGVPDSVWLVSGSESLNRIAFGFSGIKPPDSTPDTIQVRLIRAYCTGRTVALNDILQVLELEHGGFIATYRIFKKDEPLPYFRRRAAAGALEPILWADGAFRSADSVRMAGERAVAQAAARERSLAEARRREAEDQAAAREVAREKLIRSRGWSFEITRAVIQRRVTIGMTAEMVREAWGPPRKINETVTASGRDEQWVYDADQYVYLRNGVVRALQTSRESQRRAPLLVRPEEDLTTRRLPWVTSAAPNRPFHASAARAALPGRL